MASSQHVPALPSGNISTLEPKFLPGAKKQETFKTPSHLPVLPSKTFSATEPRQKLIRASSHDVAEPLSKVTFTTDPEFLPYTKTQDTFKAPSHFPPLPSKSISTTEPQLPKTKKQKTFKASSQHVPAALPSKIISPTEPQLPKTKKQKTFKHDPELLSQNTFKSQPLDVSNLPKPTVHYESENGTFNKNASRYNLVSPEESPRLHLRFGDLRFREVVKIDAYGFVTLDLHHMTVHEAEQMASDFIDDFTNKENKVRIITGRGARSKDGIPKIKPAIKDLLESEGLEFCEIHAGGCLEVCLP
ncbi:uncharacterized protein LOC135205343 [Macrobrachium nipponense]|uniref:uncharacterized protein LOC135205343 n=1 Tax=Macrobrachium nipponense TaxID=159736 RepID=UPI0030C856AB